MVIRQTNPQVAMEPMKPLPGMKPIDFGKPWWPSDLGEPSTSRAQNEMRYAFFPEARRLLIEDGGKLTTYDAGDHQISGVSQAQSRGHSLTFTSQEGPVDLAELKRL